MFDYTLQNLIPPLTPNELAVIAAHPLNDKKQWTDVVYNPIKSRLKEELYFNQNDRCAYCRKVIEADAKYEPIDHIVAKSVRPNWMLEPHNLIVTCDSCNNLKNDDQTLSAAHANDVNYPVSSDAFLVFNPHFDTWSEHLQFEDELFLTGVQGSKGPDTVTICRLYRYNIIINRAKELKLRQKTPMQKTIIRLSKMSTSSQNYDQIKNELLSAMNHFAKRMQDNPNFE